MTTRKPNVTQWCALCDNKFHINVKNCDIVVMPVIWTQIQKQFINRKCGNHRIRISERLKPAVLTKALWGFLPKSSRQVRAGWSSLETWFLWLIVCLSLTGCGGGSRQEIQRKLGVEQWSMRRQLRNWWITFPWEAVAGLRVQVSWVCRNVF